MRRVTIADTVRATIFTDEAMVVDIHHGVFYGLNTTATCLWVALATAPDADTAIEMAIATICARHAIDPGNVRQDLNALLGELLRHRLVEERP